MTRAKITRIAICLCLVAVLAVGSTYAYLSYTSGATTNVFTFGNGIDGKIEEPDWPGTPPVITPGAIIKKNPQIVNTTTVGGSSAYAAIMIVFKDTSNNKILTTTASTGQYTLLSPQLTIDFAASGWTKMSLTGTSAATYGDAVQVWYYDTALVAGGTYPDATYTTFAAYKAAKPTSVSSELFTKVTVANMGNTELANLKSSMSNGFTIDVYGSLGQADTFTDAADAASSVGGLRDLLLAKLSSYTAP